jgi:P27 family predicted phage terminase small subunit
MKSKSLRKESDLEAPAHLSARSRQLWNELKFSQARDIARRALFQSALECLDRADAALQTIEKDGMISKTRTTGALHVHPAVRIERESRAQFAKIWHSLGLPGRSFLDRD